MGKLDGKIAIITGASRGQGAAEARLFVQEGARVVLTDVDDDEGELLARELSNAATFVHHDVTEKASWDNLIEVVLGLHQRVDILVNNAGVFRVFPLEETAVDDLDLLYRVNQRGVFLGMQAVAESMRAAGGGSIVNIASTAATKAAPNVLAYASTKWAVLGMTKNAALELAKFNVRVNAVLPGIIDTTMIPTTPEARKMYADSTPLGRMGVVDDVARTVLFLASEESSFITGGEVTVDGGLVL